MLNAHQRVRKDPSILQHPHRPARERQPCNSRELLSGYEVRVLLFMRSAIQESGSPTDARINYLLQPADIREQQQVAKPATNCFSRSFSCRSSFSSSPPLTRFSEGEKKPAELYLGVRRNPSRLKVARWRHRAEPLLQKASP
jgi:hypothetical protein